MKTCIQRRFNCGITLLDVTVIVVILAFAAALLIPIAKDRRRRALRARRMYCVNNLKQVGLGVRNWAIDNGDQYPMKVATTHGGTMDHPLAAQPWVHLRTLSNELVAPNVLVCPSDEQMKEAFSFDAGFGSNNVSYFVGVDATERRPSMFLTGDRNLTLTDTPVVPGLMTLATNADLGWTMAMHTEQGNVGLSDGSVQQASASRLRELNEQSGGTNRLAVP